MLWWFAQNFFIAAVLACIVGLVCRIWRINPVARHAMWLVVLIKLITPPLGVWPWAIRDPLEVSDREVVRNIAVSKALEFAGDPLVVHDRGTAAVVPQGVGSGVFIVDPAAVSRENIEAATRQTVVQVEQVQRNWLPIILRCAIIVWVVGSAGFTLLQLVRIIGMMRRLRCSRPGDAELIKRVTEVATQLGMRGVRVRVVPGIASPAIWAVVRPVLLWPAELPADLSDRAVRGLIVHELAHARRRDHWVGWVELLAGCVWWWNPLFWYVRHEIRENAELACDAWVVDAIPKGRRAYAEAILAVCENLNGRTVPPPSVGAKTGGRRFLERRLAMILRERFPLRLGRIQLVAVLVLGLTSIPAWSQRPGLPAAAEGQEQRIRAAQEEADITGGRRTTAYRRAMMDGIPVQQAQVPDAARALIDDFERQKEQAKIELEQRLERQRQELIAELKDLAAKLDQTGSTREAQAVRNAIAQLRPAAAAAAGDPGTLINFRDRVGQTFVFEVTGAISGTVWGDGTYTDDSPIATAAVHAGVLKEGERGMVQVRILPGQQSYNGANRNGVTSSPYATWQGSYTISAFHRGVVAAPPPVGVPGAGPGLMSNYRQHVGQTLAFEVTGSDQGAIWGDGVYTDDSAVAVAAVHSGVLKVGERGMVYVMLLPGQPSYAASEANGIASRPWPAFDGSFKFLKAPDAVVKKKIVDSLPRKELEEWIDGGKNKNLATWNNYLLTPARGDLATSPTPASPVK